LGGGGYTRGTARKRISEGRYKVEKVEHVALKAYTHLQEVAREMGAVEK